MDCARSGGMHSTRRRLHAYWRTGNRKSLFKVSLALALSGMILVTADQTRAMTLRGAQGRVAPATKAITRYRLAAVWGTLGSGPRQFNDPTAVAVDARGNVFVADTHNDRVQELSPSGTFVAQWGGRGRFNVPQGVAVDRQGNVYVGDTDDGRVVRLSGHSFRVAASKGKRYGAIDTAPAVAVDTRGDIYVVDYMEFGNRPSRLLKFSPGGMLLWQLRVHDPGGVAVDGVGRIYVIEGENIVRLSPQGRREGPLGGNWSDTLSSPNGLATDTQGDVYVTDNSDRVGKVSPAGRLLAVWGTTGSRPGQLKMPWGLAVDMRGNVYVADSGNNRIQTFSPGR